MNIDLNYLRYFYFVAKENGFTKAAEKLHVQQPVVSRAIKLLEKEVGTPLLERQRKRVILTAEGEKVFQQCCTIFSSLENIAHQFSQDRKVDHLSIACSDSLSSGLVESLFSFFKKQNPQFRIVHHTGSASLFLNDIESGAIDMGIFFNLPELPTNLAKTKIAEIEFHFVIKTTAKDRNNILNSYIATNSQSYARPEDLPLFKKYKSYHKQAQITFVSNSSLTRKSAVIKGQGVSVLPEFLIRDELRKGILESLYKTEKMSLYLIERQSSYRNLTKNQLVEEVKKIVL